MPHFCLGGRLPLPTPLMAVLIILNHSYDLSDEGVCKRWIENPYWRPHRRSCAVARVAAYQHLVP
jgi:hypothetical protein